MCEHGQLLLDIRGRPFSSRLWSLCAQLLVWACVRIAADRALSVVPETRRPACGRREYRVPRQRRSLAQVLMVRDFFCVLVAHLHHVAPRMRALTGGPESLVHLESHWDT